MKERVWLKNITLRKSPGFDLGSFPPIKKLGKYLNIVWGPNAVGKSTLSRAMRFLIWKCPNSDSVEADATIDTPDSPWNLSISRGHLRQLRLSDNQELRLPGRNDELSESYWFPLHELLQEDESQTETFLKDVRKRMQGGVDLDASREAAGAITSFSRSSTMQARNAKQALDKYNEITKKQSEHQNIQNNISSLNNEIEEGHKLSSKKEIIVEAISLNEYKSTINEEEKKLSSFHPSIKLIDKSSLQRLENLEKVKNTTEETVRSNNQTLSTYNQDFKNCNIEEDQLKDRDKPRRIYNKYEDYRSALTNQKTCEQEFDAARETLDEWEKEHSWLIKDPPESNTLASFIDKLRTLATECEPIRCKVDVANKLCENLGEHEEVKYSVSNLSLLKVRLFDWIEAYWKLQGIPKNKVLKSNTKKLLLLLVLLIGTISSLLAITINPLFFASGPLLILLSVLILLPSSGKNLELKTAEEVLNSARKEAEKILSKAGKTPPTSWTSEECLSIIDKLNEDIQIAQEKEKLNQKRNAAKKQLKSSKQNLKNWTDKWQLASKALGLKDDEALLEGSQFFHFANRLQTWSTYRLDYVKKESALLAAQKESNKKLLLLQRELDSTENEIADLKATMDGYIDRFNKALNLKEKITTTNENLKKYTKDLEESKEELRLFWGKIELEFGNKNELRDLVNQIDEFNNLKSSLKYNSSLYKRKVSDNPEAFSLSKIKTLEDLYSEKEKIEKEESSLNEKRVELGRLKETFKLLSSSSELSTAQLNKTKALDELETFRQEQVMGMMINKLSSNLKEESEKLFQPQVVKEASKWFSKITNHSYELLANNEGFFAKDITKAKNYKMSEISSGTRIQLLFAIRMAFITMQEQNSTVRLPIFLDELLANSDDDRAIAIAQAVGKIAEERQVFYFTAQKDEVDKLIDVAATEVAVFPLHDLEKKFKVEKAPLKYYSYTTSDVPKPDDDENYHKYGTKLSVASPSLWQPIENLHSWHLLNNSKELYGYLLNGWNSIGQLSKVETLEKDNLLFRIKILKKAQELAKKGRCKTLHIEDLQDPQLKLNRDTGYWEKIEEIVGKKGITGNELMENKIPRFSEENSEILYNWLVENRFATEQTPNTLDEIVDDLFVQYNELKVNSEDIYIVKRWLDKTTTKNV